MSNIAIIPARGGSKRIPKKNIKLFCGEPIIRYSIENTLESDIFDDVIVSTDDDEIADLAISYGARVPFLRNKCLADDYTTTGQVILDVIKRLKRLGKDYKFCACVYPTAPFMSARKIKEAMEKLILSDANEIITVVKYSSPPQRAFFYDSKNIIRKWPQFVNSRSQDLEFLYYDAGQFYGYRTNAYVKNEGNIQDKIIPYILLPTEVQDIDNIEDWELAEMKYKMMCGKEKNEKYSNIC